MHQVYRVISADLLFHVSLSLGTGDHGSQDRHLVKLEELLTQTVLQVLVQLAARTERYGYG